MWKTKSHVQFRIIIHSWKSEIIYFSLAWCSTNKNLNFILRLDNKSPLGFDLLPVVAYFRSCHTVLGRYHALIFSPIPFHGISSCPQLYTWPQVAMQLKLGAISCFDDRRRIPLSPTFLWTCALTQPVWQTRPPSPGIFFIMWTMVPMGKAPRGCELSSIARTKKNEKGFISTKHKKGVNSF